MDSAWFDFRITGAPVDLCAFKDAFKVERFSVTLTGAPDADIVLRDTADPNKMELSSGLMDIDDSATFDRAWECLYYVVEWFGLKISGGIYYEVDNQMPYRGSFNDEGKLDYSSIGWVRNELTAEEVTQLKKYAETTFGRKFHD